MGNYDFVRFKKEDVFDFKEIILPNVMEDLVAAENYEERGLVCLGALREETPVGALIAQLFEQNEVHIHSIYVEEDDRKNGIGKELIEGLLGEAMAAFDVQNVLASSPVKFFVHMEYALEEDDRISLEAFLKKCEFTDFVMREPDYIIPSQAFKENPLTGEAFKEDFKPSSAVRVLTEEAEGDEEALMEFLDDFDMDTEPDYSAVLSKDGEPFACILTEYGMDNSFAVTGYKLDEVTENELLDMLKTVLNAIAHDYDDFEIIISGRTTEIPEFWQKLALNGGTKYSHQEAGMYVLFE